MYRADTKRLANTFCRSIDTASQMRYFIATHSQERSDDE